MTSGTIRHLNDGFIPSFGADFDEKLHTITEILTEKSYNIGGFELNIIYHDENIEIELPQINSVYTHMLGHDCHSIVAGEGHANANQGLVKENVKKHNPDSPFLIGDLEKEEKSTEANQKSWLNSYNQISFV